MTNDTVNPSGLQVVPQVMVKTEEYVTQTRFDGVSATYPLDFSTEDVIRAIDASGTLDFWNDPAEDIYRDGDGTPT